MKHHKVGILYNKNKSAMVTCEGTFDLHKRHYDNLTDASQSRLLKAMKKSHKENDSYYVVDNDEGIIAINKKHKNYQGKDVVVL